MLSGTQVLCPMRDMERFVTRVAFSPDESHIVAMSDDGMVSFWDASSGVLSSKTRKAIRDPSCNLQVCSVSMGWMICDGSASKIPPMIPVDTISRMAVSKSSIAFGTNNGHLVIMHFPPNILTRTPFVNIEEATAVQRAEDILVTEQDMIEIESRFQQLSNWQDVFLAARQDSKEACYHIVHF